MGSGGVCACGAGHTAGMRATTRKAWAVYNIHHSASRRHGTTGEEETRKRYGRGTRAANKLHIHHKHEHHHEQGHTGREMR